MTYFLNLLFLEIKVLSYRSLIDQTLEKVLLNLD